MQDLSFSWASVIRHLLLMSAFKHLMAFKTEFGHCNVQERISTLLWENGAMISEGLIRLSIREECRDVNFPKLTFSVLRKLVFTGIKYNNIIILIDHLYSIGLLLFFFIADFLIIHSAILLFLFDQTPNCFSFCCPPISKPLLRRTCN